MSTFQSGCKWSFHGVQRPRRGPCKRAYHLSRRAYQARLKGLARWTRPRSYEQSQRIRVEIALRTLRGESYRGIARNLGLRSHCYCRRIALRFLAGLIPMLPLSETGLLALLAEIDGSSRVATKNLNPFPVEPVGYSGRCLRCSAIVYDKSLWLCTGCYQLWRQISRRIEVEELSLADATVAWN
jgi:hypothetical protein